MVIREEDEVELRQEQRMIDMGGFDVAKDPKYEYVYAKDVFKDDNGGLYWGVESVEPFPEYLEWYPSLNKLLKETKDMKIINKEQFLLRFRKTHKIDKSGNIRKIPKRMRK